MRHSGWSLRVSVRRLVLRYVVADIASIGMNIRWDYFVNQYDTARYVSTDGARDNRHIQFVREFASIVSILQVRSGDIWALYHRPDDAPYPG